jgi:hypothetical protein
MPSFENYSPEANLRKYSRITGAPITHPAGFDAGPSLDMNSILGQSALSMPSLPNYNSPMSLSSDQNQSMNPPAFQKTAVGRAPTRWAGAEEMIVGPGNATGDKWAGLTTPSFMDKIGGAINKGMGGLGAGLGALTQPLEYAIAPVNSFLSGISSSPLGGFASGFGQGVGNYKYGGFGTNPGPRQPTNMNPSSIEAEILRLQGLLSTDGVSNSIPPGGGVRQPLQPQGGSNQARREAMGFE